MVATHIKNIKHFGTGMYLRDMNTNFVILHLNVSRLSICSSCELFFIKLLCAILFFVSALTYEIE